MFYMTRQSYKDKMKNTTIDEYDSDAWREYLISIQDDIAFYDNAKENTPHYTSKKPSPKQSKYNRDRKSSQV